MRPPKAMAFSTFVDLRSRRMSGAPSTATPDAASLISEARPLFVGRPRRDAQLVCLRNRRRHKIRPAASGARSRACAVTWVRLLDDRADFPVRAVGEVDRLNLVLRRGFCTECAVSDSFVPVALSGSAELLSEGTRRSASVNAVTYLGRVPGGRH